MVKVYDRMLGDKNLLLFSPQPSPRLGRVKRVFELAADYSSPETVPINKFTLFIRAAIRPQNNCLPAFESETWLDLSVSPSRQLASNFCHLRKRYDDDLDEDVAFAKVERTGI